MSQVKEESEPEICPLYHRVRPVPLHGHPQNGRLLQLDDDIQVAPIWGLFDQSLFWADFLLEFPLLSQWYFLTDETLTSRDPMDIWSKLPLTPPARSWRSTSSKTGIHPKLAINYFFDRQFGERNKHLADGKTKQAAWWESLILPIENEFHLVVHVHCP